MESSKHLTEKRASHSIASRPLVSKYISVCFNELIFPLLTLSYRSSPDLALPLLLKKSITLFAAPEVPAWLPPAP